MSQYNGYIFFHVFISLKMCLSIYNTSFLPALRRSFLLWLRKGSLMKTQTRILDNRLYYIRNLELHRKAKKSRTVQITSILICLSWPRNLSVLITVRRIHYGEMGKAPTISFFRKCASRQYNFELILIREFKVNIFYII